jgi:hypothetical protein
MKDETNMKETITEFYKSTMKAREIYMRSSRWVERMGNTMPDCPTRKRKYTVNINKYAAAGSGK